MGLLGRLDYEVTIDLVLLFADERNARSLAAPLWSALEEVATYFSPVDGSALELPLPTRSGPRARIAPTYRHWYVDRRPPPVRLRTWTTPWRDFGEDRYANVVELTADDHDRLWSRALDRRSRFDGGQLVAGATEAITAARRVDVDHVVVVTDAELVPPREWRYLIWDVFPGGAVVSTAPMDPVYWGASMPDDALLRRQRIKHGTRAAVASVVGERLGLARCHNRSCFLFDAVDNANLLDGMRHLGDEHSVTGLRRGYFPTDEPLPEEVLAPDPDPDPNADPDQVRWR